MLVKMNDKKMRALVRSKIIQEELERSLVLKEETSVRDAEKKLKDLTKRAEDATGPVLKRLEKEMDDLRRIIRDAVDPDSDQKSANTISDVEQSSWVYLYEDNGDYSESFTSSPYYLAFPNDDWTSEAEEIADLLDELETRAEDPSQIYGSDDDVREIVTAYKALETKVKKYLGPKFCGPFDLTAQGGGEFAIVHPLSLIVPGGIDKIQTIQDYLLVSRDSYEGDEGNLKMIDRVSENLKNIAELINTANRQDRNLQGMSEKFLIKNYGVFQYKEDLEQGKVEEKDLEKKEEIDSAGIDIGFAKLQDFLASEGSFSVAPEYKGRASKSDLKQTEYLIEFEKTMKSLIELVYSIIKNLGYSPEEAAVKTNNIGMVINNLDSQRGQLSLGRIGYNKDSKFGWWGSVVNFITDLKAGNVSSIPVKPLTIKEAYLDNFPKAGDGSVEVPDTDADKSLPKKDGKPGGSKTPQGKSMIKSNDSVKKMQKIFMSTAGDKGGTPDLKFQDDGKWGKYTQEAWEKYLKSRLSPEDFDKVGSSGGRLIYWSTTGYSGANQIHTDAGYDGTAASALRFVQALGDSLAKGDKGKAGATDPDDSTPGSKEIVTMPVLDNNGKTIISVHMYKDAIKSFKNYKGIGRWIGADFKAKFLSGGQFSDEDVEKFSITIPGIDYKVPLKDISKITYKDKKKDKLVIHRPGPNIVLFRDAESNTWSAKK